MQGIPMHPPGDGVARFLVVGEIIQDGDRLVLSVPGRGAWPAERVQLAMGAWGHGADGVAFHPRPTTKRPDGSRLHQGDMLLVGFLDGSHARPVIVGVLQPTKRADQELTDLLPGQISTSVSPNRKAARVDVRTPQGQSKGKVDIIIADDDRPTIDVAIDERCTIVVGTGTAKAEIEVKDGKVTITASEVVVKNTGQATELARKAAISRIKGLLTTLKSAVSTPVVGAIIPPTFDVDINLLGTGGDITSTLKGD